VNSVNDIIEYLNSLPEVKRLKELETYIDKNDRINSKIKELKELQKKMVNSKEFNQPKQYNEYKNQYKSLFEKINDMPFVEEYLELLEIVDNILKDLTDNIEIKIEELINSAVR